MARVLRDSGEIVTSEEIDDRALDALSDPTRMEILRTVAREPLYPAEIARIMDISKQKAHYHFSKLKEANMLEEDHREKHSGGTAVFYRPSADAYTLDLDTGGRKVQFSDHRETRKFLEPFITDAELNGKIVVGSPDEHGPDQVRARDGHLSGEISMKLGNYASSTSRAVRLDTEIAREESYDQNLFIIGGILTNTAAGYFNNSFPACFEEESFPYHRIITPGEEYSDPGTGVITKTRNPEDPEKAIYMVAGVRSRGTRASVLAFKEIEDILPRDPGEEFYAVVRGQDMDGDGEVDSYETVEVEG